MKHIPSVKAVMTPFPHQVEGERSLADARRMMEEHDIRHLPVIKDGRLAGVLTDKDIRLASGPALTPASRRALRVSDVLGQDAYIVELTEPLDVVALHMARERIDAALVVKNSRLVGIFTMNDACRALGDMLRTLFPGTGRRRGLKNRRAGGHDGLEWVPQPLRDCPIPVALFLPGHKARQREHTSKGRTRNERL